MAIPPAYADWFDRTRTARQRAGLRRTLTARPAAGHLIDLASNDYLGLARDCRLAEAATRAAREYGTGATGSALVTGHTELHAALEHELAAFLGAEAALVFASGYAANLGAVAALAGRDALVVSDADVHASLVDAARLSRARVVVTPHADVAAVRRALAERTEARALVLTDAVQSSDGTAAPVAALAQLTAEHGAMLVVDEAHAIGVRGADGAGLVAEFGLAGAGHIVVTGSLSKSLGAQGGFVVGAPEVRAHLVDAARAFIFDTALAPPAAGAAREALRILRAEPERVTAVRAVADVLAHAVGDGGRATDSAIVPYLIGDADRAVQARDWCAAQGLSVGCFRPPSVPAGTARLRLTARADLTGPRLERVADVLGQVRTRFAASSVVSA